MCSGFSWQLSYEHGFKLCWWKGEKPVWAVNIASALERKPMGSCYGSTAVGITWAVSLDERKEEISIFKNFLIYIPTTPYGKMEFLPCCFGGAVGDIFSLIMALVLGIIVPNPHQQPVDLPVELALFYVNATLTRKWATCSLLLHFAISNSKNHTT